MLQDFINLLEQEVKNHSIYVWGAQGQKKPTITEAWIKSRETSTTNERRAIAFWKKQVAAGYGDVLKAFDCSGLGIYCLQKLGIIKVDMTANGLMGKCTILSKSELKKGDWVFKTYTSGSKKGKAYHIGYIVDDVLNVIEAQGRDAGVVKRTLSKGGWNTFGRPSYFKEEIEADIPAVFTFTRLLKVKKPMMEGKDIKVLQEALNKLGFDCGKGDGVYGTHTQAAVKGFQKAKKLTVDGIVGKRTVTALGYKWEV
jgi:hypothetical protein